MGLFDRIKQAVRKTKELLKTDIRDLFKKEGRLVDEAFLKELYAILIKTDMGSSAAGEIRDQLATDFRGRVVHLAELLTVVKAKLKELMAQGDAPLQFAPSGPTVILVVGVNGSGKTTSIAKLAYELKRQGKSVVLGAGDTFRAAAVEQLTIWSQRIGVEIVKGEQGGDPASVAFRAATTAVERKADVCLVDTAGRLQTQTNLMQQLNKIRRVITKAIPDAPHEVLLVLDATAGQNGLSQAKGFSDAAGCTGIVLAKLDGTAKGGVVIAIARRFGLPIRFVGVGEQAEDFGIFDARAYVEGLLRPAAAGAT